MIDEQLIAFCGRCHFRMYIPSKPAKYRIKLVMLCDSKTFYTVPALPYIGKGTHNGQIPLADYFVKEHAKSIYETNRNITTNDCFTSVPLVSSMLHDHKLTTVGALSTNMREIPTEMIDVKGRPVGTSLLLFDKEMMMMPFCPKKNKVVLLLSTMHRGKEVDTHSQKPETVKIYNKTEGSVDTLDQLCNMYSCSTKTRRWPLCVIYALLNMAGVNAIVLFNSVMVEKGQKTIPRKTFLLSLGQQMDSKPVNSTNYTCWCKQPHQRSSSR
jgi:hypothetical protein